MWWSLDCLASLSDLSARSGGLLIFTQDYSASGHSPPPVSPAGSFLAVTTSNNVFAWYKSEIRFNNLRVLYEVDCQPACHLLLQESLQQTYIKYFLYFPCLNKIKYWTNFNKTYSSFSVDIFYFLYNLSKKFLNLINCLLHNDGRWFCSDF